MGKGQSPSPEELIFIFKQFQQGAYDSDVLHEYKELDAHGKLGHIPFRTDIRFIRQQRKAYDAVLKIQPEQQHKQLDPRFIAHCEQLACSAEDIASIVGRLIRQKKEQCPISINDTQLYSVGNTVKAKIPQITSMRLFEIHLQHDKQHPLEGINSFAELSDKNVTPELFDRLNTLVRSKAFEPVSYCPICRDLTDNAKT
jgi:hypothetical protein